jgi:putative spermidine/putrescine transport system permease protein
MRPRRVVPYLLSLPALVFIAVLFVLPVGVLVARSLVTSTPGGGTQLSLSIYARLLGDPYVLLMIWRTFKISAITTLITLFLAFPVALYMRQLTPRARALVAFVMLSPLLTSVVVRTLAWVILLGPRGVLNDGLALIGLGPVALIYNEIGVIIGLTHVFFGYMVLALMASVLKIDENLLLAASNLGAGRWSILWRIIVPLSLPGILAGSVLVFTMSASTYATPALLGGSSAKTIALEIYDLAIAYLEWAEAAALAAILFALICVSVVGATRWAERGRWKSVFQ